MRNKGTEQPVAKYFTDFARCGVVTPHHGVSFGVRIHSFWSEILTAELNLLYPYMEWGGPSTPWSEFWSENSLFLE
jgi:hypothetical protein